MSVLPCLALKTHATMPFDRHCCERFAQLSWSGIKLASDAKRDSNARNQHKHVSCYSMGAALVDCGIMLMGNH
ncbi:MAG: hypothetical protein M3Z05_15320 [Gemmatimonadota bacterium]|nr:hypothetical protein [Gemmatimonadota bacterium]